MPAAAQDLIQPCGPPVGSHFQVGDPLSGPNAGAVPVRTGQRAGWVGDVNVADPADGPALDRGQVSGQRDNGVADGPWPGVGDGPELDQGVRQGQDVGGHRPAFGAVAVQQRFRRAARRHQGQLPGQVVGVHDPGVHALPARRAVDVHGVPG